MTRKKPINFTIYGEPVAQPRAKKFYNIRTGKQHGYVSKRHAIHDWRDYIQFAAKSLGLSVIKKPIGIIMELSFYLRRPKSNKNKNHVVRPDIDNYAKAVMDALEGIIYEDDSQVYQLNLSKEYSTTPRLTVVIRGENEEENG